MLPLKVFIIWMLKTAFGWKCPSDVEIQMIYAKTGEHALISFQTSTKSYDSVLTQVVVRFDHKNLYAASFYNNILQNEKSYFGSEFIGDARTGNYTVKTANVMNQDGGTYMLRYRKEADMVTEQCAILYILDKPIKATVIHDSINVQGDSSTLACSSMSTTYPKNHTLRFTYNWKINNVTNPSNTRYVYSSNKQTLLIKPVEKEDANASIKCIATEFGEGLTGYTSDDSEKSLFVVIYGPEKCEINTTSPFIMMEGDSTTTINCEADCYPSCSCGWRNESSGSTIGENGSFNIKTVSRYQTGNYSCTCINTAKDKLAIEIISSLYIKVEYIDFFINGKRIGKEITFDEYAANVNFYCKVKTFRESTVQLLLEEKVLQSNTSVVSFTYTSVMCLYAGMYTCAGSDQYGGKLNASIRLFVRCSPRSNQQIKQNFTSQMYTPSILSFTTIAYPVPGPTGFIWHKRNVMHWEKLLSNTDIHISSSLLQSNLTIRNVTASDYGQYRVTVKNEIDIFEQHLFLVEKDTSKTSPNVDQERSGTDHTWMIVGITFGLLTVVLSGYSVYVTILLRRHNVRKGEDKSIRPTDPAYYEKVGEDSKTAGIPGGKKSSGAAEYENPVKMYTDLVRYSNDDKATYDIIQSSK